jgi:hypothetical protein
MGGPSATDDLEQGHLAQTIGGQQRAGGLLDPLAVGLAARVSVLVSERSAVGAAGHRGDGVIGASDSSSSWSARCGHCAV